MYTMLIGEQGDRNAWKPLPNQPHLAGDKSIVLGDALVKEVADRGVVGEHQARHFVSRLHVGGLLGQGDLAEMEGGEEGEKVIQCHA